jgi:hypothetical protein
MEFTPHDEVGTGFALRTKLLPVISNLRGLNYPPLAQS